MYYCGIDIAKYRHELCLLDENGDTIISMHLDNSQKSLDQLTNALSNLGINGDNINFCMEATGHYWLPLYCKLNELGFKIHVINPIQSDALRNLYVRKTKTDKKDSLILADLLRLGRAPSTQLSSETTRKAANIVKIRRYRIDRGMLHILPHQRINYCICTKTKTYHKCQYRGNDKKYCNLNNK